MSPQAKIISRSQAKAPKPASMSSLPIERLRMEEWRLILWPIRVCLKVNRARTSVQRPIDTISCPSSGPCTGVNWQKLRKAKCVTQAQSNHQSQQHWHSAFVFLSQVLTYQSNLPWGKSKLGFINVCTVTVSKEVLGAKPLFSLLFLKGFFKGAFCKTKGIPQLKGWKENRTSLNV